MCSANYNKRQVNRIKIYGSVKQIKTLASKTKTKNKEAPKNKRHGKQANKGTKLLTAA